MNYSFYFMVSVQKNVYSQLAYQWSQSRYSLPNSYLIQIACLWRVIIAVSFSYHRTIWAESMQSALNKLSESIPCVRTSSNQSHSPEMNHCFSCTMASFPVIRCQYQRPRIPYPSKIRVIHYSRQESEGDFLLKNLQLSKHAGTNYLYWSSWVHFQHPNRSAQSRLPPHSYPALHSHSCTTSSHSSGLTLKIYRKWMMIQLQLYSPV